MIDWMEISHYLAAAIIALVIVLFNLFRKKTGNETKFKKHKNDYYFDTRYGKKRYQNEPRGDVRK